MRGGAWESEKAELVRSLKSLKPTPKFYIVFFSDEFEALPEPGSDEPPHRDFTRLQMNIDHARRWIQSVQLNRGGPPKFRFGLGNRPRTGRHLSSDRRRNESRRVRFSCAKINRIEDIVSGPQVRVAIHAIAYFSLDGQQLMRQLAKENNGQFIYVPKPKK